MSKALDQKQCAYKKWINVSSPDTIIWYTSKKPKFSNASDYFFQLFSVIFEFKHKKDSAKFLST